jgi:hypothetical protein
LPPACLKSFSKVSRWRLPILSFIVCLTVIATQVVRVGKPPDHVRTLHRVLSVALSDAAGQENARL